MRLTALCVCGTLLAFTSLFWTTADSDEGDLLWDNEFGPCTANLRPEGPCRHRQDESTCPYLFSLPPLTVHLPKQLRELEKIVEDLQKLKDNVDQLRKMCADCKVSQTERECGRQREHEKLNESADRRKDERNWLNETNGRLKDFRLQCGTDRVKAENTTKGDGDTHSEKTISEEKERKKWETERERSDKVIVKENEDEETLEMTEKDGKTQTEGAKEKDKFGQANDGNERIVDMVIKNVVEKNNRERETDRNKEKESKGNSKGDRGHVREKEKERKTTSNIKNKEKTEESTHHVWRDETKETEKKTQTEEDRHSDGIKMSEDHDGHTNQERRQYEEERKKEMEKGIKMERNNEKPKQTESIGHAEKEKTIKEGEVERDWESAMEIKTEGEKAVQTVQRDGDGELASSKATERTDFVSISTTPHSTISLAPRHDSMDSNKAVTFASPPSSSSLTSRLNTGVNQGRTIMPDRLPTQSTGLDAGGISEHPGPDAEAGFRTTSRPTTATINTLGGPGQLITSANTRFPSTTSARPETGFQGQISSTMETTTTTTPHQNLYTTKFPGVADRNRWTAKKNISSNTKTGVKPLPGRGLKPGEKHKPAIKPEADRRPKNPKNDHKPDRAPSPDSKTKHDQKQKPTHQKPTTNQKPKPGKDPKQIKNPKPDQRPENLPTDQNLKNTPKRDQEHTTDQNKLPIQKPKSNQKFTPPVQRPTSTSQTVNATKSHRDPQTNREITIIDQESKPDKKPVNPLKTDDPDQNLKNEEKTNHDQRSIVNQYFTPAHEFEPETTSVTPKPNQKPKTELIEDSDQNLSSKPKSIQEPPGQGHTPDQNQLSTQKPKSHEKSLLPVQRPTSTSKTVNTTTSDKDPVERTIINQKPEKKPVPLKTENPDKKQKPPKKLTSEEKSKPDQRSSSNTPVQEPEPETSSLTSKPNQKPKTELLEDSDLNLSPKPKSVQDPSPGQEHTPDQNQLPTQKPKSSQKSTLPVQKSTGSDKDSLTDSDPEITIINQELKPEEKPVNPLKTNNHDQNQKPTKKPESEEKSKPDQRSSSNTPVQELQPETSSLRPKPNQKPEPELLEDSDLNLSPKPKSVQEPPGPKLTTDRVLIKPPNQKPKPSQKIPRINQTPKLNQKPPTGQKTKPNVKPKPEQTPQTNGGFKTPRPDPMPNLDRKPVPESESSKTFKPRVPPKLRPPTRPTIKSGATPPQRPKPAKPSPKTKTKLDPLQIGSTTSDGIQNSQTDMPPASGPVRQIAEVTHSPGDTELKTITLGPKTAPFPHLTMSPNSRITSDLRPQTAGQVPSIPMTTRPNKIMHEIFPGVIPSASPGSTKPKQASKTDSRLQAHTVEETAPSQTPEPDIMVIPVPSPRTQTTSTTSSDLRSTTPATSGPEPLAAEASTPSARELRVKINQVAAFFNNSLSPNERPLDRRPKEHPEDNQGGSRPDRTDSKLPSKVTLLRRDCSEYRLRKETKSGVYLVTPDLRGRSFRVFCDMELDGGGWTVLQRRQDGSVSFNRTWAEYRSGFGELDGGEFWLGNNLIHLLTRDGDMVLRVELEDFDGVMEHAEYEQFRVANERLRYRLTVGRYSGTAGDALRFSKSYDHNNRAFTTPDRDHDRYPSGNCGAYYSSGWWFDACMAANLNGRYYVGKYKGVRDGIFWGTWHNISTEYYLTNYRQSFKTVRMMIRPKGFTP